MKTVFAVMFFGLIAASVQAGITYQLTDLGTLGGADSRALGINNAGDVVGWAYTCEDEVTHAYKYSRGQSDHGGMQDIHPTGYISEARGVNASGSVVGMVVDSPGEMRATLWQNNSLLYLSQPGVRSVASAINDSGMVTGDARFSADTDSPLRAFRYTKGLMQDIGTLGGSMSSGAAIDSAGNIVGSSLTASTSWQQHAFFYPATGDMMHDLGTLGGEHSQANGINDAGQIVGWAWRTDGHSEAFVYSLSDRIMRGLGTTVSGTSTFSSGANGINENGDIVGWWSSDGFDRRAFVFDGKNTFDLNTLIDPGLGWTLVEARAINDSGAIVGFGIDPTGVDRGFLLTPVSTPCPSVAALPFLFTLISSLRRKR